MRNEKINLAILLLVSFLLSLYLYLRTYVISLDGAFQYIPLAKNFVSGSLKEALVATGQQPFYSLLIALASRAVPDFEIAGKLVASLLGILIIFPVYFLGKRIFDEKIAFFSILLLTLHPYIRRFSADVLKESTYLFFLASAIWFSWKTIQGEKKYPYFLTPFLSVLAYLVRPDGIEILLIVFFYILFVKKFHRPGERWWVVLFLFLSSALLFLPYLIHLRETTGTWTLSRTKSFTDFLGMVGIGGELSTSYKILFTLKILNFEIFAVFHPFYLFLMAVGLFKKVSVPLKDGEKFLISFFSLHYLVLFLLVLNVTDWGGDDTSHAVFFSGRHVMPFLIFSIYWVGEGFMFIFEWLYRRIGSTKTAILSESKRSSMLAWLILFSLTLAIVLPKTLKPQRYERLPEKWAGLWIKNQSGHGMSILTTLPRVAYYADGKLEYIDIKRDKPDRVEALMAKKEILYCVIRGKEAIGFPREVGFIGKHFLKAIHFKQKGMDEVIVYKKVP